jgi:mono/diheme cytochrome c family protein
MRRIFRWLTILVGSVVALAVALVAYVYIASGRLMARTYALDAPSIVIPSDPASIGRGKYIYEKVAICAECHGKDLGGRVVEETLVMGRLVAPNLTAGSGGLRSRQPDYSDQDFLRAVTHGVKRNGRSVIFMPSADFHFTPQDLGAVIAYVKSAPPVDRTLPDMWIGPLARALGLFADFPLAAAARIDHASNRLAQNPNPADAVAIGDYLVSTAGCRACHGQDLTGGGGPPPGASNITPVGIGDWTEQDFFIALRTHKRPNGSVISDAMPRPYGEMSDEELRRILGYLRTVPAAGQKTANQQRAAG